MSFKDQFIMKNSFAASERPRNINDDKYVEHYDQFDQFEVPNSDGESMLDIHERNMEQQSFRTVEQQHMGQGISICTDIKARSQFDAEDSPEDFEMSSEEEPSVQVIIDNCSEEDRVFTQQHFNSVLSLELGEEEEAQTTQQLTPKIGGKIKKIKTKKQKIKRVKAPKFPFGPFPKPNINVGSLAAHFQQASHGLNETWIFWIDENITGELHQHHLKCLSLVKFNMFQFQNIDQVQHLMNSRKYKKKKNEMIIITTPKLIAQVADLLLHNGRLMKVIINDNSDIDRQIAKSLQNEYCDILYSVENNKSRISKALNECHLQIYHDKVKDLALRS